MAVHLHGGRNRPDMDGRPEDTRLPGETKSYRYANQQ